MHPSSFFEMDTSSPAKRLFVFAHPRTRTNLFFRILQSHPQIYAKQYPFVDAFVYGPERQESRKRILCTNKEEECISKTFQGGLDELQLLMLEAEKMGKIPLVKEHVYHMMDCESLHKHLSLTYENRHKPVVVDKKLDVAIPHFDSFESASPHMPIPNPTILPDRFFTSLSPIIIIRHPARAFPSYLRVCASFEGSVFDSAFPVNASFKWVRLVFDCYDAFYNSKVEGAKQCVKEDAGRTGWPIVIDGDNLVSDPEGQMKKLCERLGLDPSPIRFSWDAENTNQDQVWNALLGTVRGSTGVIRDTGAVKPIDVAFEARKWAAEWNEEVARKLEAFVNSAMDDYDYLRRFSI